MFFLMDRSGSREVLFIIHGRPQSRRLILFWATGKVHPGVDPFLLSIVPGFSFPDRDHFLERVDQPAAGLERLITVGCAHRDDHADLARAQVAGAVIERELDNRPASPRFIFELGKFLECHLAIAFILKRHRLAVAGKVPHGAQKRADSPRVRRATRSVTVAWSIGDEVISIMARAIPREGPNAAQTASAPLHLR